MAQTEQNDPDVGPDPFDGIIIGIYFLRCGDCEKRGHNVFLGGFHNFKEGGGAHCSWCGRKWSFTPEQDKELQRRQRAVDAAFKKALSDA